jgi:hypothetical protein
MPSTFPHLNYTSSPINGSDLDKSIETEAAWSLISYGTESCLNLNAIALSRIRLKNKRNGTQYVNHRRFAQNPLFIFGSEEGNQVFHNQ